MLGVCKLWTSHHGEEKCYLSLHATEVRGMCQPDGTLSFYVEFTFTFNFAKKSNNTLYIQLSLSMNANTNLPHDPVLKMYNNAVGRVGCIMGQRMLLLTVPITSLGLQGNSN